MPEGIVGKTITVYTLDGKMIKGNVIMASDRLLGIENDQGRWIIMASAIASLLLRKEE